MQLEECCWKMVQTNLLKPKLQIFIVIVVMLMLQHTYSTKESMMLSPSVRMTLNFVSLLKN